jgi:cytosine/adenosine deaminase-related metal-dependent hydrolase
MQERIMRVVVSGGLVVADGKAELADIVLEGDTIAAVVPPGSAQAPEVIDASSRLVIPGLINAHTHGHGGLAKGLVNVVSLELLLNAGGWMQGKRTDEDRYLSTLLNGIEMIRKGCTACYDLSAALPVPTEHGLNEVARAYADLGMRAVIAPMIADRSFYQAIPGLLDAFPPELRAVADGMRTATADAILAPIRAAAANWSHPADQIRLGIAPTIPLHCSVEFMTACRDMADAYGMPLQTHLAEARGLAGRFGNGADRQGRRDAGAQPGVQPAPGQRHRRHAPGDGGGDHRRRRDRRVVVVGQPEHVRGDAPRRLRVAHLRPAGGPVDRLGGGAAHGDRGQRRCARHGGFDRPDRAGLQG